MASVEQIIAAEMRSGLAFQVHLQASNDQPHRGKPTPELNSIGFTIDIETTNTSPDEAHPGLLNRFEEPDSEVLSVTASSLTRFEDDDIYELTEEDENKPGFNGNELYLSSEHMDWTYTNDKGFFTIKEVVECIEDFERMNRPKTEWFGGIDCHHIFFEGLHPGPNGSYSVFWGS